MSLTSFLDRDKKRGNSSYRRSKKQEKEIATRIGGRRTAASGAKDEKGDVRKKGVLRIEAKTTKHKSFSVTLEMIEKIEEAALSCNELPAIIIEFNDGRGRKLKEIAIIPSYVLGELCERS